MQATEDSEELSWRYPTYRKRPIERCSVLLQPLSWTGCVLACLKVQGKLCFIIRMKTFYMVCKTMSTPSLLALGNVAASVASRTKPKTCWLLKPSDAIRTTY